jgi:hypothetical protein
LRQKLTVTTKVKTFHKLGILINWFNGSNFYGMTPSECITLTMLAIFEFFATVRLYGNVPFLYYIAFPLITVSVFVCLSVTLISASLVHFQSNALLQNLRHSGVPNKYIISKIQALRPSGIQVGEIRHIVKLSLLTCYLFILNNIVALLLALPSEKMFPKSH